MVPSCVKSYWSKVQSTIVLLIMISSQHACHSFTLRKTHLSVSKDTFRIQLPSLFLASTPDKNGVMSGIHDQNQQFPDSLKTEWGEFAHDLKPIPTNGEILPDVKLNGVSRTSEPDK